MKDNGTMKMLLIAAGAYGVYWYLQNYGPSGAVTTPGGVGSYWYSWFGASSTTPAATTATTPVTTTPAATSSAPATTQSSTPPPVMGVAFQNTSRGGSSLYVGDKWQLTIMGAPNSPVTGSAQQNGNSLGTSSYGTTNAQGVLVLTGTADPTTLGTWNEQWSVGGVQVGTISFTVLAAPAGTSGLGRFGAIVPTNSVPGNAPTQPASPVSGWSSLASLASGSSRVH